MRDMAHPFRKKVPLRRCYARTAKPAPEWTTSAANCAPGAKPIGTPNYHSASGVSCAFRRLTGATLHFAAPLARLAAARLAELLEALQVALHARRHETELIAGLFDDAVGVELHLK